MAGMAREDVPGFLAVRARTTALVDASTAVVARHGLLTGRSSLSETERAWAARTPGSAARGIARELGRGLLRLARSLWPGADIFSRLESAPPRPLVMGAIAAHTSLPAAELVRLVIYDDAAAAAAALLKLDPGDPAQAMRVVLETCSGVEGRCEPLAALTSAEQIPAANAPQGEEWTEHHAHTTRRLFRA